MSRNALSNERKRKTCYRFLGELFNLAQFNFKNSHHRSEWDWSEAEKIESSVLFFEFNLLILTLSMEAVNELTTFSTTQE